MNNTGILVQIIGAVVDADFSQAETLPALLNALEVDYEVDGRRKTLVLEVQQHIGDGWVRAVAMSSTGFPSLRQWLPSAPDVRQAQSTRWLGSVRRYPAHARR